MCCLTSTDVTVKSNEQEVAFLFSVQETPYVIPRCVGCLSNSVEKQIRHAEGPDGSDRAVVRRDGPVVALDKFEV